MRCLKFAPENDRSTTQFVITIPGGQHMPHYDKFNDTCYRTTMGEGLGDMDSGKEL